MAKARSPSYPAISLREALDKVESVYRHDYQNRIPRAVVAQHMGYESLNGKSLGVIAAAVKYGLLEGRGDETRVTDTFVTIHAHAPGEAERAAALRTAASTPELFAELDARFQDGRVSDQAIRAYLLTQKFIPPAADAAIRAYRDTKAFVEADSPVYKVEAHVEPPPMTPVTTAGAPVAPLPTAAAGPQYRVSITPDGLEVSAARLDTPEAIDKLIRILQANKLMFETVYGANDTGDQAN